MSRLPARLILAVAAAATLIGGCTADAVRGTVYDALRRREELQRPPDPDRRPIPTYQEYKAEQQRRQQDRQAP